MIPTHSLFDLQNRFPKNGLQSLKFFNFSVCDFRNLLHHIKWLQEQYGNELNDFKQIAQAQQVQFFDILQFFPSCLGPFNMYIIKWVPDYLN